MRGWNFDKIIAWAFMGIALVHIIFMFFAEDEMGVALSSIRASLAALVGALFFLFDAVNLLHTRLTRVENQPRVDADDMAKRIATKIRELLRSK